MYSVVLPCLLNSVIAGLYDPSTAPPLRLMSRILHSIYRVETPLGQAEVERVSMDRNCKGYSHRAH